MLSSRASLCGYSVTKFEDQVQIFELVEQQLLTPGRGENNAPPQALGQPIKKFGETFSFFAQPFVFP